MLSAKSYDHFSRRVKDLGLSISAFVNMAKRVRQQTAVYDFETYRRGGLYMATCRWSPASDEGSAHLARYRLDSVLPLDRARTRYGSAPWIFTGRRTDEKYQCTGYTDIPRLDGDEPIRYPVFVRTTEGKPVYRCYDVNHRDFAAAFYIGRGYANAFTDYIMLRGAP